MKQVLMRLLPAGMGVLAFFAPIFLFWCAGYFRSLDALRSASGEAVFYNVAFFGCVGSTSSVIGFVIGKAITNRKGTPKAS